MWTAPQATEMRFGFEVTMYIMNKQFLFLYKLAPLVGLFIELKLSSGNKVNLFSDPSLRVTRQASLVSDKVINYLTIFNKINYLV